MTSMNELIKVVQLPVIEEHLRALKDQWEQRATDATAMVCTEDTIQAIKAFRADMRKEFDEVEALRKAVKKAVLEPYEEFNAVYKDCVTTAFNIADNACAEKIDAVEAEQKRRCEEGLRDYFAELCAVRHLDWLDYERAEIRVDMASAKAKTPTKLRKQIATFVAQVGDNIDRIAEMDYADEILVEFRRSLRAEDAIFAVHERHRRIEEQHAEQEARKAAQAQEAESVRRVEALAPPVIAAQPKILKCTFTVRTTADKLKKLKEFLNMEEIQYE